MELTTKQSRSKIRTTLTFLTALLLLTGCMSMSRDQGADDAAYAPVGETNIVTNEPYYPVDFRDLLIPGELAWNREKSVSINTASFTGGILSFNGRVEVNSLTDLFINSMKKDGWNITGTVKSRNVLLAFIKPQASCMINIAEGGTLGKTEVTIYIAHTNG
jgi:hypothetical protein